MYFSSGQPEVSQVLLAPTTVWRYDEVQTRWSADTFVKYLNSGAIILQQVEVVGDRRGIVNGSKASQTERVLGSKEVPATETIPASSIPPLLNCGSWIRASIIH